MISMRKAVVLAGMVTFALAMGEGGAQAEDKPVIGANNTTYSPQNFSGRWKLRQTDGEICLIELKLTDASPHDLGLRGCTQEAIISAVQWEMRDRDLVFFAKSGAKIGPFKVTAPNTLESDGMVMFR